MSTSHAMLTALKAFHLDNPEATFEELTEHLRNIAVNALEQPQGDVYGLVLSDLAEGLAEAEHSASLTVAQAKALKLAYQVLRAHRDRVEGNVGPLVDLLDGPLGEPIGKGHQSGSAKRDSGLSVPLSVSALQVPATASRSSCEAGSKAVTYMTLFAAYMVERGGDMAPATVKNLTSSAKTVAAFLGEGLDMRSHTRADMVKLREALLVDRKASTVNKLLTTVATLTAWGVATGLIDRDFAKRLTIAKGADSERQAFTAGQIIKLTLACSTGHLRSDWRGHALALGVATGARIGEIHQLRGCDFIQGDDGQWALSINDDNGKTLKNSYSRRIVPLVGIPESVLKALAETNGRIFGMSMSGFSAQLNTAIRDLLGTETGEGLSFHSLRHSMASDLKTAGVSVGIAQAILGHSSGSLAFDLYGGNAAASMGLMAGALRLVR
ncbi:tyrosine-type recombinase/integrase [Pseudomonas soli]|uniref:tyrosine-type recombinase/integrase n=1 Tax=Pseudomonas soli TaxID=1306993 RepID=UPI002893A388|nr:tyrosine-type recombinase/integrase [Pseudomonas soli]MDT3712858.1 tyrosine-type recombinase/integrase [Pseudomonas soli]MDT3730194.1 tyrosine-type recombinase/integrase [Pseudomonas soli]